MIRFEFGGSEYTINFLYKQRGRVSSTRRPSNKAIIDLPEWDRKKKNDCLVVCSIHRGSINSRDDDKALMDAGLAFTHPNDRFVKETGRKIALTNALIWRSDKTFRAAAWNAYHNRSQIRSEQTA